MRRQQTLILVAILTATVLLQTSAEVYKWTDTLGNVHYGDQPPSTDSVEQLDIQDQNLNISPAINPENDPQIEKSLSTDQIIDIPEVISDTDYVVPEYQCFDAYDGEFISDDVRSNYTSHVLSDVDIRNLNLLFEALDNNWVGELEKIDCFGTINKPREKKQYFATRISGQWSKTGQLELEINYYNSEKSSLQHVYWWLIEDSKLYFGDRRDIRAALKWVIDLDSISAEKLAFRKKIYKPNVKQIQVKKLAVISRSLYLTELLYTNGLLTGIYYWRLN